MLTDEMKKSIEEIVDQALGSLNTQSEETVEEEVKKSEDEEEKEEEKKEESKEEESSEEEAKEEEKEEDAEKSEANSEEEGEEIEKGVKSGEAPKESTPENGGKDQMKSGSPHQEKQKMMKSLEELTEILPADEVELIAAWREENSKTEETVAKSQGGLEEETKTEDLGELVKSAVASATEGLIKSINDKDELIKSMNEKIEKMASRPAYDKRSVDSLEPIEKSGDSSLGAPSKAEVLNTMLELQKSGAGINSYHVSEYEATESISDPRAKKLITDALKKA